MIIIKTKTGDIFVNDMEMVNVTHNRELHTAFLLRKAVNMEYFTQLF